MLPITERYLADYVRALDEVGSQADLYGALLSWQWSRRADLEDVVSDLNNSCGLEGPGKFLIHPPTTAVGSLAGIVVVAANPGWDARRNPLERAYRSASREQNRALSESLFIRYPLVTGGTSGWWTKVLKLGVTAYGDRAALELSGRELWSHVHSSGYPIGGVDLVPFHSSKDHITRRLLAVHPIPAIGVLRDVAVSTLRMALRLKPKLLLVASPAGSKLIASLAQPSRENILELDGVRSDCLEGGPWDLVRFYRDQQGVRVLTFPQQIFSMSWRAPAGFAPETFASIVRGAMRD